ncbi:MAG: sensor domain-containing diguanylate cyclase [Spirulina sp.]
MAAATDTQRLVEIIRDLCFAPSLDIVMTLVAVAARELTHADGATFVLKEDNQCFYAHENAVAPLWKGQRFPLSACICGWAINNKQAAIIEDVYRDARIPVEAYEPTFVKSLTVMPIGQDDPLGVIGVYWADRHQPLEAEIDLLKSLAETTAMALRRLNGGNGIREADWGEPDTQRLSRLEQLERTNAKLRAEVLQRHTQEAELTRLSLTDGLTGLYNRRGFYLMANPKLRQARRQRQTVAVAFIDVDYLKQVNDHFGHEAGDWLILGTAEALHRTCTDGDILARLGGDEFVVFLSSETDTTAFTDQLRAEAQRFMDENQLPYPLSLSVGLVVGHWHQADLSLHDLVNRADTAMYHHKQRRRPLNMASLKAAQRWNQEQVGH